MTVCNRVNVALAALALFVFASTFSDTDWGDHWVFIAAYAAAAVYCTLRQLWIGLAASISLIVLRYFLLKGIDGLQLRLASTTFVVLFLLLCMARAGDVKTWRRSDDTGT